MYEELHYNKYIREIHREILTNSEDASDINLRKQLRETLMTLRAVENQEAIIFIGGDKSGKSTLINHLLGNPLVVNGPMIRQEINIAIDKKCTGPLIGMHSHQQIRGPTIWSSNKLPTNKMLVEFPSFGKFSSLDQEKFNHLIAPVLYSSVKRANIVLVWNVTDILTARYKEYLEQIKFLESLFDKHLTSLIPGFSIVFTHVPEVFGKHPFNVNIIVKFLNSFITNSNQLVSPQAKRFLSEIIIHPFRLGMFKKPVTPGPFISRLEPGVRKSFLNGEYIPSEEFICFLYSTIPNNTSLFSQELADTIGANTFAMLDEAAAKFARRLPPNADRDMKPKDLLNAQKNRLMDYRKIVTEGLQFHVPIRMKIEILGGLDSSFKKIVQESQLCKKLAKATEFRSSARLAVRRLAVMDKAMNCLLMKVISESELIIENIDLQIQILKENEEICELKEENQKLEKESIKLLNKINAIKRKEQKKRRKGFLSRIFECCPLTSWILPTVNFFAKPLLRILLKMPGVQYMASVVQLGMRAFNDMVERDRELSLTVD